MPMFLWIEKCGNLEFLILPENIGKFPLLIAYKWYKIIDGNLRKRMVSPLIWKGKLFPVIYNSRDISESNIKRV